MKKALLSVFFVLALLIMSIGSAAAATQGKTAFSARLGAVAGTDSDAHGNAVFIFSNDSSEIMFKLVVNGLENTTVAHIHVAPAPGNNGPPVLWLYPDSSPPSLIEGVFNGLLASRTASSAELTGAAGITSLDDLREAIEEGRAYVNVHSSAFPGGEIRGDIR